MDKCTRTHVCSGPTRFSELLYLKRVGILNLLCPLTRVNEECRHINKQTNLKYKSIVRECAKYILRGGVNYFDMKNEGSVDGVGSFFWGGGIEMTLHYFGGV